MIRKLAIACGVVAISLTSGMAHAQDSNDDDYPLPTPRTVGVGGVSTVCVDDVPWIEYSIKPQGFVPTGLATLTIYDKYGKPIETHPNMELSGSLLYPGAKVDEKGNATAWPGWVKDEKGNWIELPKGVGTAVWREGVVIRVDVNPTAFTDLIHYPDASPECAGPEVTGVAPEAAEPQGAVTPAATGVLPSAGELPSTGSDATQSFLQLGVLMLVVGGVVLIASHRRRSAAAPG